MQAIISDLHGNLGATQAVLADAEGCGATEVICLGDLVGYGPDPIPCVELAMQWAVVVQGNHDLAALSDDDLPEWTRSVEARRSILRFREDLKEQGKESLIGDYLTSLPTFHRRGTVLYVHGSPRHHVDEYLFPEDIYLDKKMAAVAAHFDQLCFCGHTHVPGIFVSPRSDFWEFYSPQECGNRYRVGSHKVICNVGSVGQPRDGDQRAGYVLFDGETITFRRVDYDIGRALRKMRDDDDGFSGSPVRRGR